MNDALFEGLTEEQVAKAKACRNEEELLALAKKEGVELSEEQLAAVSGGGCIKSDAKCPRCGSKSFDPVSKQSGIYCKCRKCGKEFKYE